MGCTQTPCVVDGKSWVPQSWVQQSWQDTVGSSRREHAAASIQATGKVEDKGVSAIVSRTKSPLRLEWGNPVCLGSIVWNLLLEIGTYALSFKRLHKDQCSKNKDGRRKGGDSFYYIMPWYSKYMLRKWEAWVPLPPQPEGPKPTYPTSHESAPTTRLEATLGEGSSSTSALKLHRSTARNYRLRRLEVEVGKSEEGARVPCQNLILRLVTRELWVPSSLPWHLLSKEVCLHTDCWLHDTVMGGEILSSQTHAAPLTNPLPPQPSPCPWGPFPGRQQAEPSFVPLPVTLQVPTPVPASGAGAATALCGEVSGAAIRAHQVPCQGSLGEWKASGCLVLAVLETPWKVALGTWVSSKVMSQVFLGFPGKYRVKWL